MNEPSFIVSCPFVHQPSFDAMWDTMHPRLRERALVIDNTVVNLGAAGSRNAALAQARWERVDWIVEVSPVTRFGPTGGLDMIAALDEHADAWVIQSAAPVNWHCIAWSVRMHDIVGTWDENLHPIYGEDGDMSRRIHLARAEEAGIEAARLGGQPEQFFRARWACVPIDAWITMYGHSAVLAGIVIDQAPLWAYYSEKWGSRSGAETFTRPFNRTDVGLDWWPRPPDPRSIYDEVRRP